MNDNNVAIILKPVRIKRLATKMNTILFKDIEIVIFNLICFVVVV